MFFSSEKWFSQSPQWAMENILHVLTGLSILFMRKMKNVHGYENTKRKSTTPTS